MKKLVLITSTLFLSTFLFGQEQTPQKIQQLNKSETSAKVINGDDAQQLSTKNENTNQPVSYTVGRDGVQHTVGEEKEPIIFSVAILKTVEKQLKELFGEYYEEYGAPNIEMYAAFFERCEFISIDKVNSDITNISTLELKDKYNPEEIYHDNFQVFNPEEFNVLKYQLNLYSTTDQYYRIYNTDSVLKINKLN